MEQKGSQQTHGPFSWNCVLEGQVSLENNTQLFFFFFYWSRTGRAGVEGFRNSKDTLG